LTSFNNTPDLAQAVELAHGGQIKVFALSMDRALYIEQTFGIADRE